MNHEVRMTVDMGRGVFSSRDIAQGDVITVCELLPLSASDTVTVNTTELRYYTFQLNKVQDCLVLGVGEIFNHHFLPNVSYKLVSYGDRLMMQFEALVDIPRDTQLFIDYAADSKVNVDSYLKQKSLV